MIQIPRIMTIIFQIFILLVDIPFVASERNIPETNRRKQCKPSQLGFAWIQGLKAIKLLPGLSLSILFALFLFMGWSDRKSVV